MARKRATDLSKTDMNDAGTDSTACDFWPGSIIQFQ